MPTKRSQKNILETPIKKAICDWLDAYKILWWRENNTPVPIRKGKSVVGFRRFDERRIGIPDLFALVNGHLVGIETKRSVGGKQTTEQMFWQNKLIIAGGDYVLATCVEDVELIVKKYL